MIVYRMAVDTLAYTANDWSGKGAANAGGRWNALALALLYAATSQALAYWETFAYLTPAAAFPMHRALVKCTIPADLTRLSEYPVCVVSPCLQHRVRSHLAFPHPPFGAERDPSSSVRCPFPAPQHDGVDPLRPPRAGAAGVGRGGRSIPL